MSFSDIEFKASSGTFNVDQAQGIVECFVAGVGNKDSVGDVLLPGAFNSSLKRRKPRVVWGHNWNDPIGKVLEIYEVPPTDSRLPGKMKAAGIGGLYARVQFNLNSEKGREAFANVAFFGEEQEWSIGYKTIQASFDPNLQANILREVELYEVSPVLHGANQLTGTISVKSDTTLADEEKGHGMMGMPGMPHSPGMPSGMMKPMAPKPQQAVRPVRPSAPENPLMVALRRELVKRSGSNVIVRAATENTVVFDRLTSDGESSTYRVAFHFQDGQFMFGKPERVQSQTVYTPEIPAIPSSPAQAFAVSMKPQGDAYLGDDPDDFMPMPGKSDDLDFDDFFLDDIEEKIGRSLNKRNLAKLKNVMEMLQDVLASAEKEVEVKSAEYVIPVDINNAFHTKQLLDPIMDYHRVDSYVSEKGIVITSGVTPEFIDAVETLKKGLGNRIGRAIGGGGGGKGRRLARGLTARFDPNAWDGDGDGIVQEGTPFQRPAIPGVNDRSTRGRVNTQAAIQAAQGQGINTGRGLRSSGGKDSNDDASILKRREAGESLQDVAESLGMRREDVRKAELRAIRQRDAKRKTNDEILKRREAGESLQDVAQSLNMRREDVRQAELEAKNRRDGGLRSGTAIESMAKMSPSERKEAFRNIVKDQLELFDATGDDEIDFYREYLSELMSDFLSVEAPSGDYSASKILDGSESVDKESVSDLLSEVQDAYEKLGGKGRFGDMYKTRGKRAVSEDDQIASLLALGTVLDSVNNKRVRSTDKQNSDALRNMVRSMQSAGDSKGRPDGLRSRTAKANSVEQREIIDAMGDRFAEMTIDEQTKALQRAIEALDASLGNDGDTSMDDVDEILLENLGEVLSRFMPSEQGDYFPPQPGSDWTVASVMQGDIPDEFPGAEELSDLISTLKDQYIKLSDGDRDDFTKFFPSRRRPKSPLSEDDKNNARLALIATLSAYGRDRGGPFEDIQQLADSIDAGGSRRGLRSSTDRDDVDALLDDMQVEIDRDRAIVDARLAGKVLDDVAEEYGMSREEVRKLEIQEIKKRAKDLIPARTPAQLAQRGEPGQEPRFQDTDRALAEFILRKRFEGTPVRELAGILGVRAEDLRAWEIAETRGDPRMNRARGLRSSSMDSPLSITDRRGRRISEFLRDIEESLEDYPTAYSARGGLDKDWVDGLIRDMKNGTTNFEDMNRVLKLAVDDMNMERAKPSPDEARLARQLEVAKTARRVIVEGVSKEELENLNPARRRSGMRSTTENLGKRGSGMVKRDEKGKIDPTESREARQKIESDIVGKLRELGFSEDEINTLTNGLNNKFPTTGVRSSTGDVEVVNMRDVEAGRASAAAQQARQARLDASKELRDIRGFMQPGQQGGGWDAATADRAMELFESIVLTDITPENIGDELNRIRQSIIDIAANGVRNTGGGGDRTAVTDIAYLARDLLEERVKAANIPDNEYLPDPDDPTGEWLRNWDSFSKDEIIELLDDWRDRMERNIEKLPIRPNPNDKQKARIRGLMSSTRDRKDRVSDVRKRESGRSMIRDLDESSRSRTEELFDAAANTPFTRENMRSRMDSLAEDAVRLMSDGLFGDEGEESAFVDVLNGFGEIVAEQIASALGIDDDFPVQNPSVREMMGPWGDGITERVFDAWDDKGIGDFATRARIFKDWTGKDRAVTTARAARKPRPTVKEGLERAKREKTENRILRRREAGESLQEVAESLGMRREDVRKAELRAMRRREAAQQSRTDSDEGMRSSTRRVANNLSMTLSDDEIAQLRDEIPMLKRFSANGAALDALDEKLKNARNGKVDLTPDEVEQIEDAIESAKEPRRDGRTVVTSDIQGVIDQAAESEGGKYVSLNWEDQQAGKRGNLGLRSNNNNGAPADIDEARQKKLVFFMNSARGGSLGVSMRIREEYNRRGDGTLLAKDWKALDTLYSNITGDANPKKSSGRGMRSSTSDDDTGGGGIRVTGLGDTGRSGSKGRPMGSRAKEDSKGKTFQSMKPDNWDGMTAEQQFNWMADHSPERSGMRKVDYERVMKEVLDREASDERRAERGARRAERGPVQPTQRQPQQGPKEVAVKPRPANDEDATTERRDDSRRINNFLDKTVNDASRLSDRGRIDELHAEAWDEIADIMDSEDLSRNQIKAAIQRVKNYLADAEEADDTDGPAEKIIQRAETLLRTLNGLDTYYKNDKFIKDGPEIEVAPRRGRAAADIADISDDAFDDTGGVVRRVEGRPLDIDDNVPTPDAEPAAGEVITRRMGEGLRSSVPVNANRVVSQEVRDYVAARSRNTRGLRSSTDSKQGRTEIKAEATFFKDILDSLPKEIREADKAQDKRTSDALKALQDLISRQEAAKLGSRRTNAGRILMTRDEVDEILDAMMVVIDRQGAIGGNERQQKFATMLDMLAKAAMATFIDRTVEELSSRTVNRRNQRGREVEIQDL